MGRKDRPESADFEALRDLGFELEAPQDEFSYQPESTSAGKGIIAKEESGIDVEQDADDSVREEDAEGQRLNNVATTVPGESEWSQVHRSPEDIVKEERYGMTDSALASLVAERLNQHPNLKSAQIEVTVCKGTVFLRGRVQSDSAKVLVREVVESLPGVLQTENRIRVQFTQVAR